MKWSKSYLFTLKEEPSDAEIPSHKLLVRGGFIKKVGQGVYSYGHLLLKSVRKFEKIIREELEAIDSQEMLMPMAHPSELWKETNRWDEMGKGLLKFKNRLDQDWCLGATHEEVITDYVRGDLKSYKNLPVSLFQIQTKYRDEVRPRFGLMRGREFLMKDAYSFDEDREGALKSYERFYDAYNNIFSRLGLNYRVVQADAGNIGGDQSQEFHILADSGEDHLLVSEEGTYAANVEICPVVAEPSAPKVELVSMEEFATPGLKTIDDLAKNLGVAAGQLVKTLFYSAAEEGEEVKPVCVLVCGSDELNPIKLKNKLGLVNEPLMLTDQEVKAVTGAAPGSCGPVGLDVPIYADKAILGLANYTVGANKDDFHLKNVNHGRDYKITEVADLRKAKEGDLSPDGKGKLKSYRGIEVGHIFYLGSKYSQVMKAQFLSAQGKAMPFEMGCYGIGVTRTVQAAIEQCHDENGIVWPRSIAPFDVHICLLDPKDEQASKISDSVYDELKKQGFDVLVDDRKERPGVKFKDADLLGMPVRLTLGGRGIKNDEVEIVVRSTQEVIKVSVANIVPELIKVLGGLK